MHCVVVEVQQALRLVGLVIWSRPGFEVGRRLDISGILLITSHSLELLEQSEDT